MSSSDVANYYTRGVRFPRLIGQTHDGTRIPFGPYTMTQAIGALAVFLIGQWTRPLWGGRGLLGDYLLLFASVALTIFALKFVRTSGRDPIVAGVALLSVYGQPRHGRLAGRSLRIARPHPVRGQPVWMDAGVLQPNAGTIAESVPAPNQRTPGLIQDRQGQLVHSPESAPTWGTSPPAHATSVSPLSATTTAAPAAAGPTAPLVLSGVGQLLAAVRPAVPHQTRKPVPERPTDA